MKAVGAVNDRRSLHVTEVGTGPRVMLVHGAMITGERAWAQQQSLSERWHLVVPSLRGYHPNPPEGRVDVTVHARDIEARLGDDAHGAHLVGHSLGGLICMLVATRRPDLVRSLALIEPAAHALAPDEPAVREERSRHDRLAPITDPEAYLDALLAARAWRAPARQRRPMSAVTAQHVGAAMQSPWPWEATLPVELLAGHTYPVLVVTGARGDVMDVLADAVVDSYGGEVERRGFPATAHDVQSLGRPVNDLLEDFWRRSAPMRAPADSV